MKKTMLIIEDNKQNLYLLTFILQKHGYHVEAATDGQTGIDIAKRVKPDLILLDVQLPVMDGYAVALNLRLNPDLSTTPIIAVTSYAMPGDKEKALESGCTGYIEKPINPDTFMSQVEEYLFPQ
jgi:two-component system, cell cycle response regulator DivK